MCYNSCTQPQLRRAGRRRNMKQLLRRPAPRVVDPASRRLRFLGGQADESCAPSYQEARQVSRRRAQSRKMGESAISYPGSRTDIGGDVKGAVYVRPCLRVQSAVGSVLGKPWVATGVHSRWATACLSTELGLSTTTLSLLWTKAAASRCTPMDWFRLPARHLFLPATVPP